MFIAPKTQILIGAYSSTAGTDATAISGLTTGASAPFDASAIDELTFYFEGIGTITGGTVLIEEASRASYTGSWSLVQTITATALSGGAQLANAVPVRAYAVLRVRISSAITGGGSVAVTLQTRGQ